MNIYIDEKKEFTVLANTVQLQQQHSKILHKLCVRVSTVRVHEWQCDKVRGKAHSLSMTHTP